mmetsp:Transcript_27202/g.76018  ORF Transcript_27202/g.76018 Transcript_27202/m.76018 type:complete len:241 (+) Transcript_27202:134-856(+)
MADDAPQNQEAKAPEGVKIFVGNLSFDVKEEQLSEVFAEAGKVLEANIITRGSRSRGYGFVTMATQADAEKALEALNKKELEGRAINVEIAKVVVDDGGAGRGRSRAGGRGRSRGRGRGRGRAASEKDEDRELSDTTLFVANLPFSVGSDELKNIFGDHNASVAHVVAGRSGRSKGYGFVVFKNSEDQQAALKAIDGKEVEGRELAVRVAFKADPPIEALAEKKDEKSESSEAPKEEQKE